jgi:hypothetical protein
LNAAVQAWIATCCDEAPWPTSVPVSAGPADAVSDGAGGALVGRAGGEGEGRDGGDSAQLGDAGELHCESFTVSEMIK